MSANIPDMPDRMKKRIYLFYIAGVVNVFMALAVLMFGRGVVPDDKIMWIVAFFAGFAAIDFWMPMVMKKKWAEDVQKYQEQQKAKG